MKILIIGGNGFIGSNIARSLLKEEELHDIYLTSRNDDNIQDILPLLHTFKKFEIDQFPKYTVSMREFNPDLVILCAWHEGNPFENTENPLQFTLNSHTYYLLLRYLGTLKSKPKIIGFGSFAEYGNYNDKIKESFEENPINFYGTNKLIVKNLAEYFCKKNNLDLVWIRPFLLYGKGDKSNNLIPSLIQKLKDNQDVELNNPNQVMDYLHIDDFLEYFTKLVNSTNTGVFNICSGKKYKVKDIVQKIKTITKSKSKVTFNLEKENEFLIPSICGDNTKIVKTTEYQPKTTLDKGLSGLINL